MIRTETKAEYNTNVLLSNGLTSEERTILRKAKHILRKYMVRPNSFFTNPDISRQYLQLHLAALEYERFDMLLLTNQHGLIKHVPLFRGTIDSANVYPREVVKEVLAANAAAVIFAHNHPSGLNEPSQADKAITDKLKQALALIDVRVLDHFIITGVNGQDYYSFAEHGLI